MTFDQPKVRDLITPIGVDLVSMHGSDHPDSGVPGQSGSHRITTDRSSPTNTVHVLTMSDNTFDPFEKWDQEELAQRLGTSVQTVKRWRAAGTGPAYLTIGKTKWYRPAAVIRWMEEQERASIQRAS